MGGLEELCTRRKWRISVAERRAPAGKSDSLGARFLAGVEGRWRGEAGLLTEGIGGFDSGLEVAD